MHAFCAVSMFDHWWTQLEADFDLHIGLFLRATQTPSSLNSILKTFNAKRFLDI